MSTHLRLLLTLGGLLSAPLTSWAQQPGEVTNLRWCAGTNSCLEWSAAIPPGSYRLIRGTAASLPGLLDATVDSCTVSTFSGTSTGPVLTDSPPAGEIYWFLVVATTCTLSGSAGSGTAGERVVDSSGDCAPASCSNGLRDGTESDADCGGGSCGECGPGQHCCGGADCSSLVCMAEACAGATCVDGVRNGNETDIDCGGGTCPSCPDAGQCAIDSDCTSRVCSGNRCAPPSCTDGVRNGNETDVDCGGACTACPLFGKCSVDSDCQSGFCQSGACALPACPDTDGDGCLELADCCSTNCGTAGHSGDGTLANPYSDCIGVTVCAYCTTTSGILASCGNFGDCRVCGMPCVPSCTDGVRNGNETDVDCGGGCAACANDRKCSVDVDCQSGYCQSGTCQLRPCPDTDGDGCWEPSDLCVSNCAVCEGPGGSGTLNDPYCDCVGVAVCAYCTTTSGIVASCGQNTFGSRTCGLPCQTSSISKWRNAR